MKLCICMNEDLLNRLDVYAKENSMKRSAAISAAVTSFLIQQDAANALKSIAVSFRKIAMSGEIDEEDKAELQRLADFCATATGYDKF